MTRDEFASLALSYLEEVTAYARRLSRSAWDADDLVQGAFEHGFRRWQDLADPARCRGWLFRITRNLHIDRVRQMRARTELRLVEPRDSRASDTIVSPETVERLTAHDIDAALAHISEERREAVLLCDLWGFRYAEISAITNVPVGTVRSRISRARSELARLLTAVHEKHDARAGGKS